MSQKRDLRLAIWLLVGEEKPEIGKHETGSTSIAIAGKWGPRMESMYFLLKNGDFPASYVSLLEGISFRVKLEIEKFGDSQHGKCIMNPGLQVES